MKVVLFRSHGNRLMRFSIRREDGRPTIFKIMPGSI
jgi:hypothetical protein